MFRATNSPIIRNTFDSIYIFWYDAPTLLPTGVTGTKSCCTLLFAYIAVFAALNGYHTALDANCGQSVLFYLHMSV
jgi:hypothetical protein